MREQTMGNVVQYQEFLQISVNPAYLCARLIKIANLYPEIWLFSAAS
jgi:hypothetical protein